MRIKFGLGIALALIGLLWCLNGVAQARLETEVVERARARVATIALLLNNDFRDYYEVAGYLIPDRMLFVGQDARRERSAEIILDSSVLSQGILRATPEGKWRSAGESDYIFLRIAAEPGGVRSTSAPQSLPSSRIHAPKEELLREELPGTEILITVEVASEDAVFLRRLRISLSKLPPVPDSLQAAQQQLAAAKNTTVTVLTSELHDEKTSFRAAYTLIRLESEAPVIAALTNASHNIRRDALYALAKQTTSEAAVPPLISILGEADPELRVLAMSALSQMRKGREQVVPVLMTLLQDTNQQLQMSAAQALEAYDVPTKTLLPVFHELSSATNAALRKAAIGLAQQWIMKSSPDTPEAVSSITHAATDADRDVRLAAVTVLAEIMNKKLYGGAPLDMNPGIFPKPLGDFAPHAKTIVLAVIQSLSDADAGIRAAGARGLGEMAPLEEPERPEAFILNTARRIGSGGAAIPATVFVSETQCVFSVLVTGSASESRWGNFCRKRSSSLFL